MSKQAVCNSFGIISVEKQGLYLSIQYGGGLGGGAGVGWWGLIVEVDLTVCGLSYLVVSKE